MVHPLSIDPLPVATLETALQRFTRLEQRRVEAMYNRHRAMFAEHLVAELLTDAAVVENPNAAWDIDAVLDGRQLRIQVKCSGQFLPTPGTSNTPASWRLRPPESGIDPTSLALLGPGHHCDLFILARHAGDEIGCGWSFAVVSPDEVDGWSSITAPRLAKLRRELVPYSKLVAEIRRVLGGAAIAPAKPATRRPVGRVARN